MTQDPARPGQDPKPTTVDADDPEGLKYWGGVFGVTQEQLQEAVLAAGSDPAAVREHLMQQGSSAGAG